MILSSSRRPAAAKRILIDLEPLRPAGENGGIARLVHELLPAVLALDGGKDLSLNVFCRDELAESPEGAQLLRFLRRVSEATARSERWDLLYAPFGYSAFYDAADAWIPLIVDTLHRDLPHTLPSEEVRHRETWMRAVTERATKVQCSTAFVVSKLQEHFGVDPARTFIVSNAVHRRLQPWPWWRPRPRREPYFLYPANSWPHKNHETLLVAYRLYRKRHGSAAWTLKLTGYPDARHAALQDLAGTLGIGGSVEFLGHVPEASYCGLWQRTGALVFPSLYEGFGIPVLEAMHQGVPVIAGNTASLPEVAGDAAMLVDPTDPQALAHAMLQVATDEGLRKRLASLGKRRAKAFNLKDEALKLLTAMQESFR